MTEEGQLLVRRGGEPWSSPEVAAYTNEAHLQQLLVADPARIPGVNAGAHAVDELPTQAGPIDVCVVDAEGAITVVECKLASNSERRRMVIGQVLDYAAAVWVGGPAEFHAAWRARGGADLTEVLGVDGLGQLTQNISEARIHLCLAVDLIDSELRRLIEYLNKASRSDVMVTALQLTYAKHSDVEILVPATFGGELATAKNRQRATDERWSRERFLEAVAADTDRARVARLFDLVDEPADRRGTNELLWFGAYPGGSIFFYPYGLQHPPLYVWINSRGQPLVYGAWKQFMATTHHDGFAPLARLLGQDHHGKARGIPLGDLDIDDLWRAAVESAIAINEHPAEPEGAEPSLAWDPSVT